MSRPVGREYLASVLTPERMEQVREYVSSAPSRESRRVRVRDLRRYVEDFGHLDYLGEDSLIRWAIGVMDSSGYASGRRARAVVRGFFVAVGDAPPTRSPEWLDALSRHRPETPEPPAVEPYRW